MSYNHGNTTSSKFVFGIIKVVGGGVKMSLSSLINYFSVSGDSSIKISHKKWYFDHNWGGGGVGHPKVPFFYAAS